MIEKTWSIICDYCNCPINYWTGLTKKRIIEVEKADGTIFWKGKHFCSQQCKSNYIKAKLSEVIK